MTPESLHKNNVVEMLPLGPVVQPCLRDKRRRCTGNKAAQHGHCKAPGEQFWQPEIPSKTQPASSDHDPPMEQTQGSTSWNTLGSRLCGMEFNSSSGTMVGGPSGEKRGRAQGRDIPRASESPKLGNIAQVVWSFSLCFIVFSRIWDLWKLWVGTTLCNVPSVMDLFHRQSGCLNPCRCQLWSSATGSCKSRFQHPSTRGTIPAKTPNCTGTV